MSDVLPVPGGPCSRSPSLCGNPGTANLPVFACDASSPPLGLAFQHKGSNWTRKALEMHSRSTGCVISLMCMDDLHEIHWTYIGDA
eukprot:1560411-Pleurochrysis_carterae.AAC.1